MKMPSSCGRSCRPGVQTLVGMVALQKTTTLLRQLLAGPDDSVWREFDTRYRPVLVGVARRAGLPPEDAEDVAQEALVQFVRQYVEGRYDPQRGRVRSWILAIVRSRAMDAMRARATRREQRGSSALIHFPEEPELLQLWEEQCREVVIDRALRKLREETRLDERTIRAFELTALKQRPATEVASELGLSVDSVYAAKNRCTRQLRELVAQIGGMYDLD